MILHYTQRLLLITSLLFIACNDDNASTGTDDSPTSDKPNILLIIADDMGLDACPGYDIGTIKPNMPNLENMITTGVRFTNVWSNPTCTPTRSSILTGKYGYRTGVKVANDVLATTETSLHSYLDQQTGSAYNHAVVGKWHLSSDPSHPTIMGVNYYAGLLNGGVQSYWNWNFTQNGTTSNSTEYTTTKFTDLAIDWLQDQQQPWFLWLAYNAPHTPFHLPPAELHSQGNLPTDQASIDANPTPYYMAMLEAMDTEIGRVLNAMSQEVRDNTVIIFIGDNGTPGQVVQTYNSNRAKGTVYQGGINVPMIISGYNVSRINAIEDALINTSDLFATIAELAGSNTSSIHDSKSFVSLLNTTSTHRDYVYSEDDDDYTIRNATHKYTVFGNGNEGFYNLTTTGFEMQNLLNGNQPPLSPEDAAIKDELVTKVNEIRQ